MSKSIVCFGEVLLRLSAPGKQLLLQSPALRRTCRRRGSKRRRFAEQVRAIHAAIVTALPDSTLGACLRGRVAPSLRRPVRCALQRRVAWGLYFLTHGAGHRPAEVLYDREHSAFATAPADLIRLAGVAGGCRVAARLGHHARGQHNGRRLGAARGQPLRARTGVKVSFDCNFRSRVWGARAKEAPALLANLCNYADLIFGDDRDIAFMLGFDPGSATGAERQRLAAKKAFETFPALKWIA